MRWLLGRTSLTARGHPADAAIFRRARLRLTAWYVGLLTVIVVSFSIALYAALAVELPSHADAGAADVQHQVERETSDFALSRLRLLLVAGNLILLAGAAGGAYALAGKTLQPIAAALARQRRFAADASHELRTPLTIIRGTIDVTLQHERPAAEYHDVLQEVNTEMVALTTLVEQLLALARGAEAQGQSAAATDVQTVLSDIVQSSRELAERQQQRLELISAPGLCARIAPAILRQVVANLINNALQHTPPETTVRVAAERDASIITITVRDDGPGIPAEERDRIFEPFHRLQPSVTEGAGLGLALVRELVTIAGGTVFVEDSPGGGAGFCVRLPAVMLPSTRKAEAD